MLKSMLLVLVLLCTGARATPIQISDEFHSRDIGGAVEAYEDVSGKLTITDIVNSSDIRGSFASLTTEVPNFGYTDSGVWARINLNSTRRSAYSGYVGPVYLRFGYAQTDYVALWCFDANKRAVIHQRAGDHVPRAEWPLSYREPVFVIPGDARICYLNVKSTSAVQLPLTLYSEKEFNRYFVLDTALQAMYLGALIALAVYNLLIAVSSRSKAYFSYTAFLVSYGFFQVAYNGIGYALVWRDMSGFADKILPFLILMIGFTSCIFTSLLLNLKKNAPRFYKLGIALLCVIVCLFVLTVVAKYHTALMSTFVYSPIWAFFLLGSGCYLAIKGSRVAKIYISAWWMFVMGALVIIASRLDWLPINLFTNNIAQVASVVEFLLLSFALSDRINTTQVMLLGAQKNIADTLRGAAQQLETQVQERTKNLTDAMEELKSTQTQLIQAEKLAALGLLVSNVAHELNSPIASIVSSGSTVATSVNELMEALPIITEQLQDHHRQSLFALITLARTAKAFVPKEERAHTRQVTAKLTELGIEGAMRKARLIVRLNAQNELERFIPLLQSRDSDFVLNLAAGVGDILGGTNNINSAVERVNRIVFALKELAGTERVITMEVTRLHVTVEKAITAYKHLMKDVNVVFNRQEIETIQCDPEAMQQIWTHLIVNGLHAMGYKGTLTIDLSCVDNQAKVSVSDQGVGMTPELQERMFDAFYTTKTSGEGGGMGLAIVKKVVEQHRGRIVVESQLGVGSTFTVYLPYCPAPGT